MNAIKLLSAAAILACAATGISAILPVTPSPAPATAQQASLPVTGDYVEARTASVFAGACHYNGELVTVGRDAIMAWDFAGGSFNGVDLTGTRAVAAVTSTDSLGNPGTRKAELAIDSSATPAQVAAITALIQAKCHDSLGTIVATRMTPIAFSHTDQGYAVKADGFGSMTVAPRADAACCIQPNLVWFTPLSPLNGRKVGFTEAASCNSKIADPWTRSDEDSAFYGTFTF